MRRVVDSWFDMPDEMLKTLILANKYYKGEIVTGGKGIYLLIGDEEVKKRYDELAKIAEEKSNK